jgi:hypothetical protein
LKSPFVGLIYSGPAGFQLRLHHDKNEYIFQT